MTNKPPPREFWILEREGRAMQAAYDSEKLAKESTFYNESHIHVIEKSYVDTLQAELDEALAKLRLKDECGCCIVEHGWRMSAEHKTKALESRLKRAESLLRDVKQDCCYVGGADCAIDRIDQYFAEIKK